MEHATVLQFAINGNLGSGKSTVAKLLADRLGISYYSTGNAQRALAKRLGIDTLELNKIAETDSNIDRLIDAVFSDFAFQSNIVVDSRMAWKFMPNATKVRLVCHPTTGAKRISGDNSRQAEHYSDLPNAMALIADRRNSERARFLHSYNVDLEELLNYDLIVQTDYISPAEAAAVVMAQSSLTQRRSPKLFLSPKLLFPLDSVRSLHSESNIEDKGAIDPIRVVYWEDCFFIVDGHNRVSAAVRAGTQLISASLELSPPGNMSVERYLSLEYVKSRTYDWEDIHSFRYPFYPDLP